ncbi:MAG TPA: HAMP domain-containing sensor histidine kinase [Cyclobacteriaceae bacterium]
MLADLNQTRFSLTRDLKVGAIWLIILLSITCLSYQLRNFTNSLLLYLPMGLSIVLVHWYGYRILIIIYLNALAALWIWKSKSDWMTIALIATHEPLIAFVSKFLVDKFQRKSIKDCLSTANQFVLFTLIGIVIPISFNSLYTYHYSFVNGDLSKVTLLWLSDFITTFCLSVSILYFLYPGENWKISLTKPLTFMRNGKWPLLELWGVVFVFIVLSFFVPFDQYWFIYGIIAVVIGVRQGFKSVVLVNAILFLINYILPLVKHSTALTTTMSSIELINVHLGNATMLFVSSLVGRVVSDLRTTEKTLIQQKQEVEKANQQLNQSNQELDRFVYSVSHDLSAPLKSIQGLIHISRLEAKEGQPVAYLDMMEKSAKRLDDFINEVLDYSRTSRKEIHPEEIKLIELINELKEKFVLQEDEDKIQLKISLASPVVFTDSTLLKIVMGNLFSNALKFQKKIPDHYPQISISSSESDNEIHIKVKDNGEGIPPEHVEKVFDMFYRATSRSPGSGLGLYIAREAIHRLGGRITVQTQYGEGSEFCIHLPKTLPSGSENS